MKLFFAFVVLVILGCICGCMSQAERNANTNQKTAGYLQAGFFFFQERESQLCFAVADRRMASVPCELVEGLLIRAE